MKKPDEIALYVALRERARTGVLPGSPGAYAFAAEAERLGVPLKRALMLAEKWTRAGWWEYGVSLRDGWFTHVAPEDPRHGR